MIRMLGIIAICGLAGCIDGTSHLTLRADGSGALETRLTVGGRLVSEPQPEVAGVRVTTWETPAENGNKTRITRLEFTKLTALERYYAALQPPRSPPFSLTRMDKTKYRLHWQKAGEPLLRNTARRRLEVGDAWRLNLRRQQSHADDRDVEASFTLLSHTLKNIRAEVTLSPPGRISETNGERQPDESVHWLFDGRQKAEKVQKIWDALNPVEKLNVFRTSSAERPFDHEVFADVRMDPFHATFDWPGGGGTDR